MFPHPVVRRLPDASNSGPQRHSLHSVTQPVAGTKEREERARLRKGHRRWHSHEHQILNAKFHGGKENKRKGGTPRTGSLKTTLEWPMLAAEAHIEDEAQYLSRGSRGVKSRSGRAQSRLCESWHGTPSQTVSDRWGRGSGVGVRLGELPGAPVSPSHRPHKRPWVSKPSTPLHSTRQTSQATQTQQKLRPQSYSLRQPATALDLPSADLKALLRSLSCRSWTMGAESDPSEGLGESCFTILRLVVTHTGPHFPQHLRMFYMRTARGAQLTIHRPVCSVPERKWWSSRHPKGLVHTRCRRPAEYSWV